MNTAQTLRYQAATLLAEAARLENLPQDDYPELSVIMWTRPFKNGPVWSSSERTYHYVALKVGKKWYVTGRSGRDVSYTWDQLTRDHLSKATHLWYVTAMQEVEFS